MQLDKITYLHHALLHRVKYSSVVLRYKLCLLRLYKAEVYENLLIIVITAKAWLLGFLIYDTSVIKLKELGQRMKYFLIVLESVPNYSDLGAAWGYLCFRQKQLGGKHMSEPFNRVTPDKLANLVIAFEAAYKFQPCEKMMPQSCINLEAKLKFLKVLLALAIDRFLNVLAELELRVSGVQQA
jgi:hypothetical protein